MCPRPRVLSISSDKAVFDSRNRVLEFAGFDVVGCFNGEGALDRFMTESFDVVVIGDSLLAVERLQLLRQMKSSKPRIPIVLVHQSDYFGEDVTEADATCESLDSPEHLIKTVASQVSFSPKSVGNSIASAAIGS